MWSLWVMVAMASVTGFVALAAEVRQPSTSTTAAADQAWSLAVYRNAVLEYAREHPGFSGRVPDEALSFPQWYRPPQRLWTNRVDGNAVVVHGLRRASAELAAEVVALARGSHFAGIARAGRLVSPLHGPINIALPAGTPDGAPVWVSVGE